MRNRLNVLLAHDALLTGARHHGAQLSFPRRHRLAPRRAIAAAACDASVIVVAAAASNRAQEALAAARRRPLTG
jgi:hypothetical protein